MLLQGRNGTQNMASSFMVVGWGTVQISTRFVLKQSSSKAKDLRLWLCSKAKKSRSLSLEGDLANLSEISLQTHAEAYEGGH